MSCSTEPLSYLAPLKDGRARWHLPRQIQDFPKKGTPTPVGSASLLFGIIFAENCLKMKKELTERECTHHSYIHSTPSKSATDLHPPPPCKVFRIMYNTIRHFSLGQDTHTQDGGVVGGGCKAKIWSASSVIVTQLCYVDVKKYLPKLESKSNSITFSLSFYKYFFKW